MSIIQDFLFELLNCWMLCWFVCIHLVIACQWIRQKMGFHVCCITDFNNDHRGRSAPIRLFSIWTFLNSTVGEVLTVLLLRRCVLYLVLVKGMKIIKEWKNKADSWISNKILFEIMAGSKFFSGFRVRIMDHTSQARL